MCLPNPVWTSRAHQSQEGNVRMRLIWWLTVIYQSRMNNGSQLIDVRVIFICRNSDTVLPRHPHRKLYFLSMVPLSCFEEILTIIPTKRVSNATSRVNSNCNHNEHQRNAYGINDDQARLQRRGINKVRFHAYWRWNCWYLCNYVHLQTNTEDVVTIN